MKRKFVVTSSSFLATVRICVFALRTLHCEQRCYAIMLSPRFKMNFACSHSYPTHCATKMSQFRKFLLNHCSKPTIFGAPMNGGINNPQFAAAVISQGGVGGFGFTYHSPAQISKDIQETRNLVSGPINANFFVFDEVVPPSADEVVAASKELIDRLGGDLNASDLKIPTAPYHPNIDEQIHAIWAEKPEILTFHFGIPKKEFITEAQKLGIFVGVTATSVSEAHQIQGSGADFVVAQGTEAGGHRGMFNSAWKEKRSDDKLSTLDLVSQLCHGEDKVGIPVVAAGGIMTGRDIFAVTQAGAAAVQLGTAFLPCLESTASAQHKEYILHKSAAETTCTTAFSGRPARGIRNSFMDRMEGARSVLQFPLQNTLTSQMRSKAVRSGDGERQSLWVGTGYLKARDRVSSSQEGTQYLSVAELMQQLKYEYHRETLMEK